MWWERMSCFLRRSISKLSSGAWHNPEDVLFFSVAYTQVAELPFLQWPSASCQFSSTKISLLWQSHKWTLNCVYIYINALRRQGQHWRQPCLEESSRGRQKIDNRFFRSQWHWHKMWETGHFPSLSLFCFVFLSLIVLHHNCFSFLCQLIHHHYFFSGDLPQCLSSAFLSLSLL